MQKLIEYTEKVGNAGMKLFWCLLGIHTMIVAWMIVASVVIACVMMPVILLWMIFVFLTNPLLSHMIEEWIPALGLVIILLVALIAGIAFYKFNKRAKRSYLTSQNVDEAREEAYDLAEAHGIKLKFNRVPETKEEWQSVSATLRSKSERKKD